MGSAQMGSKNGMWKGGRVLASNGYVLVRVGKGHHLADCRGYAYEHRLVAEKMLGRRLLPNEEVHHGRRGRACNDPGNLKVCKNHAEHFLQHRRPGSDRRLPGEDNPLVICACGCEAVFPLYDSCGRPREYVTGHNRHPAPTCDAILLAIGERALRIRDIVLVTGIERQLISAALNKLKNRGQVRRVARGCWKGVDCG